MEIKITKDRLDDMVADLEYFMEEALYDVEKEFKELAIAGDYETARILGQKVENARMYLDRLKDVLGLKEEPKRITNGAAIYQKSVMQGGCK